MAHSTCLRLVVNKDFPEPRKIQRAQETLERGGVIAYPTDTTYGIGCSIFDKKAIDRIYLLKGLKRDHLMSFVCPDLSDIARYALVENEAYRIMKRLLPGPYTMVLKVKTERPLYPGAQRVRDGEFTFTSNSLLDVLSAFNAMK